MSYRNPRFCIAHSGRRAKTGSADPDYPVTRLGDYRSGPVWRDPTPGAASVDTDRGGVVAWEDGAIDRVLLANANADSAGNVIRIDLSDDDAVYDTADSAVLRGGLAGDEALLAPADGVADLEFDLARHRYVRTTFRAPSPGPTVAAEAGELWVTRSLQPVTGTAHAWQIELGDTAVRTVTRSGNAFFNRTGPPRYRWRMQHRGLDGNDLTMYRDIFRRVGASQPFWYEHPGSGSARTVVDPLDDPAGMTGRNATLSQIVATGRGNVVRATATGAGIFGVELPLAAPIDFSASVVRCAFRLSDPTAIAGQNDLRLELYDSSYPAAPVEARTVWGRGSAFLYNQDLGNAWVVVEFDTRQSAAFTSTRTADLRDVSTVALRVNGAAADTLDVHELTITHEWDLPRLVTLEGASPNVQSSNVPKAFVKYDVTLELQEVST